MTLLNRNFLTHDGTPITGRTPTQIIVHGSGPLSDQQRAMVEHAYKLFCDNVRLSPAANGYHVQNRQLADGTRIRMEANGGLDRVMVWPEGVEEPEILILASPRACFAGGSVYDGVANDEVFTYAMKGRKPLRLVRKTVFSPTEESSALRQQPGNRLWWDDRLPNDRETKRIVSWWDRNGPRVSGLDSHYERFATPRDQYADQYWGKEIKTLYVDGVIVGDAPYRIVAAAICVIDAVDYVRLFCSWQVVPGATNNRLYQVKLSDFSNPAAWTEKTFPLSGYVFAKPVFNAAGTKLAFIISYSGKLQAVEVDFETLAYVVACNGTKTVIGAPSVTPDSGISIPGRTAIKGALTLSNCTEEYLGKSAPFTGRSYFGGENVAGGHVAPMTTTDYSEETWTDTNAATQSYTRSGEQTVTFSIPVAVGYKNNELAWIRRERVKTFLVTESMVGVEEHSGTVHRDKVKHEWADGTIEYSGSLWATNMQYDYSIDNAVAVSHTAFHKVMRCTAGGESEIYATPQHKTFGCTYSEIYRYSNTDSVGTNTAGAYSGAAAYVDLPQTVLITTTASGTVTTNTMDRNLDYDVSTWEMRIVDLVEYDFAADLAIIAELRSTPNMGDGARIGYEIKTTALRGADVIGESISNGEALGAASYAKPTAKVADMYLAAFSPNVIPLTAGYSHYDAAPGTVHHSPNYIPSIPFTYALTAQATGTTDYNGSLDKHGACATSNCLPVIHNHRLKASIISGVVTNMSQYYGDIGNNKLYSGFDWFPGSDTQIQIMDAIQVGSAGSQTLCLHVMGTDPILDKPAVFKSLDIESCDMAWLASPMYVYTAEGS